MSYATDKPIAGIDTKIRVSKNELVDLGNFRPEDVDLFSINRSLNNLKRFCGHYAYSPPLSVAQHTYLCTMICKVLYPNDHGAMLMCIIHDFPEAYYGDLSSPLKRFLGDAYREKIKDIDKIIYETLWNKRYEITDYVSPDFFTRYNSPYTDYTEECKKCDHISLRIEQNMLFGTFPPEDYVQEFMQKNDTRRMFEKCSKYEIDLVKLYQTYA